MKYKIKQIRLKQGLSQIQLQQISGVSRQIISYIETGSALTSTVKVSTLEKIAKALKVKVSDLLDEV